METPETSLLELCKRKKWTLAVAESCTGGLISSKITSVAGSSDYFLGGVVSYANSVKESLLFVENSILKNAGAVSAEVANSMALGVKKQCKSDWSLAVTGIAGPSGGSPEKPVGLVWFAVVGPNVELSEKQSFKGNRKEIQERAAVHALGLLLKAMGTRG